MTGQNIITATESEACERNPVNLPIQGKNNRIRALERDKHNPFKVITIKIWK